MPLGAKSRRSLFIHVIGMNFAIHADLAHAAGDQLGVLRTEIEDQYAMGMDVGCRDRGLDARLSVVGRIGT